MVRKRLPVLAALLLVLCLSVGVSAQDTAPTLVPPTLVPTSIPNNLDALPSESGVARIVRDNVLRVGVLYNEPPFGLFNIRGVESGFDADLARSIAETWGVNIEYHQATRQNGIDMILSGEIDLLIAAQPHTRDLDSRVEFSQSYYPSVQALIVRQGDGATVLDHMADRKIGVVLGTRAEGAVDYWQSRVNYHFEVFRYLTLDLALAALDSHEIDGVVGNRVRLARVIKPDLQRFVEDPVMPEPYAIAMSRQDVNLRDLVNRTLQYLYTTGKLEEINKSNFDGASFPASSFAVWSNVGSDAPKPDQFGTDVPFPPQYIVPRLQSDRQLRVAGLLDLPADAPESQRRLDAVNRSLVNAIAQRWQVSVVPVSGDPIEQVTNGAADLAVGVTPDWNAINQVDFTSYYALHGLRLMVRTRDDYAGFADLRGKTIGVFQDDAGVRDVVEARADQLNAVIDKFFTILREQDAGYTLLVENNADVVFGDSLKLIPNVEANPEDLKLTTNADGTAIWYSRAFVGMAVPRNDINFRLLVEYTLQELMRDGSLANTVQPVMNPQDMPVLEIWPGSSSYLGFDLFARQG